MSDGRFTGGTLFSGIGAPECADRDIDWRWAAEIDPFACTVHKARFPHIPNLGDVTTVDWHATEPVDLVVGGPPCQDYSVAGQRASLSGARGDLTLQYARTLDAIDPAWSVTENVPGWLSTPDNAFGAFLGILVGADAALVPGRGQRWTDAGVVAGPRRTAAWRILDAQHFGVPQRRRRVFVVACRGAGNFACAAALFPVGESVRGHPEKGRAAGEDIANAITRSFAKHHGASAGKDSILRNAVIAFGGNNTAGPIDLATACNAHGRPHGRLDFETETFVTHSLRADGFDASEDGTGRGTPLVAISFNKRDPCGDCYLSPGEVCDICGAVERSQAEVTLNDTAGSLKVGGGKPGQGYPAIAIDLRNALRDPDKRDAINRQGAGIGDHIAHTVSAGVEHGVQSGMSVRRLTPVECERLQGFPPITSVECVSGWTDVTYRGKRAADGPRYRAIGNSMAVPCIGWVLARVQQIAAATTLEAAVA